MTKKTTTEPAQGQEPVTDAVAIFGEAQSVMPEELVKMGLADQVAVQEIPGVSPTWKPLNKGDFILGKVIDVRDGLGKFGSTCVVMQTVVPGGFRTVWLGADLKIKMRDSVGRIYNIAYDGEMKMEGSKAPMRVYRVYEILPKISTVPSDARQIAQ